MLTKRTALIAFFLFFFLALLVSWASPPEKILGAVARLVYFHGAWVWTAIFCIIASGMSGLLGLLVRNRGFHSWSQALGRVGLFYWLLFLPMSLLVMQLTWNGLFLAEPRFRVPLNLAIIGLLVQIGVSLLPDLVWTSVANLLYSGVFFWLMQATGSVLHPEAPIFSSQGSSIALFFLGIVFFLSLSAWMLAYIWQGLSVFGVKKEVPGGMID